MGSNPFRSTKHLHPALEATSKAVCICGNGPKQSPKNLKVDKVVDKGRGSGAAKVHRTPKSKPCQRGPGRAGDYKTTALCVIASERRRSRTKAREQGAIDVSTLEENRSATMPQVRKSQSVRARGTLPENTGCPQTSHTSGFQGTIGSTRKRKNPPDWGGVYTQSARSAPRHPVALGRLGLAEHAHVAARLEPGVKSSLLNFDG